MGVRKRIVYYLSGFDPRGVRQYHSIYKEHSFRQSKINGMHIVIGRRNKIGKHLYGWTIEAKDGIDDVQTEYRFLSWDDIIRREWSRGLSSYYKDLFFCIITYVFSGLILSFAKVSPKQMMAAFYPVLYLIGGAFGAYSLSSFLSGFIGGLSGIFLGAAVFIAILILLERIGNQIGVFWLLRIYAFSVRWGRDEIKGIEDRLDLFAQELASTVDSGKADEVLLISHSVGTILSISVLARALSINKHGWGKFTMVTLGECIPLVSFQPGAERYRSEMAQIMAKEEIFWIDYTSPIDGACFPLHNFVKSAGIEGKTAFQPIFRSPRFHKLYDKIRYSKLRRDWYTTHFLYLMSNERAGEYDFFAFTAGSKTMRERLEMQ